VQEMLHVSGGHHRVQEAPELAGIGLGHDGHRRHRAASLLASPSETDDGVSQVSLLATPLLRSRQLSIFFNATHQREEQRT
jgi:hypothetical protein